MLRKEIIEDLQSHAAKERIPDYQRFFKTQKGEYGEGDIFIGIRVPDVRKICKKYYKELELSALDFFLKNKIHEYRLFALLTLTYMYANSKTEEGKTKIYNYHIRNKEWVNNWDLVDSTAGKIVGDYLLNRDRSILYDLIESDNIWDQRIAIIATSAFIVKEDFKEIIYFSKKLLNHKHDLIHKALGWMLREVGKRDEEVLKNFLENYSSQMPRTMLRYSIEKLKEKERKYYMSF